MEKDSPRAVSVGRIKKKSVTAGAPAIAKKGRGIRSFSESALFTLGLAFVILYIAGLLISSGTPVTAPERIDAVAVMSVVDDEEGGASEKPTEKRGIWDILEDCLRDVLGEGTGEKD